MEPTRLLRPVYPWRRPIISNMNISTPPINSDDFTLADFIEDEGPDLFAKTERFAPFFADWRRKGTYLYRRVVTSPCSDVVSVEDSGGASRKMVMLSSNNYLGLNTRPEVTEAAIAAIRKYGTSMCGAPHLNGTYDLVKTLEQQALEAGAVLDEFDQVLSAKLTAAEKVADEITG